MDAKKEKMDGQAPDIDSEFIAEELSSDEQEFVPEAEEENVVVESLGKKRREEFFERAGAVAKKAAKCALWTVIAFLLGSAELPFGAVFFGVALLCAASSRVGYIYLGLFLSSLFVKEGAVVYLSAYSATLFIRVLSRILIDPPFEKNLSGADADEPIELSAFLPLVFSEHIWLRMASAAVGAFIIGIYKLVLGGFLYYDLIGTVIALVGAPVAVYLFSGLAGNGCPLGVERSIAQAYVGEGRRFAGLISLLAALVIATKSLDIFGMSVSLFIATFLTLYFCRRRGMMYGLVASVILGLVYSPMLAPAFAFAAIASGALFSVSVFFAALSASMVALAWALYIDGISALTGVLPALLSASLIFAVLEKLYFSVLSGKDIATSANEGEAAREGELITKQKSVCSVLGEENLDALVLDDTEQRVKVMCETFSSLSSLFYSLSERMRIPAAKDLRQICEGGFDSFCHDCEMRKECWESEYSASLAAVGKMAEALGKNGHISTSDVSARMIERCLSIPDIITQINRNASAHTQQLIIGDKTEIFALDYELISELLAATMTSQRADFEYSASLSREVHSLVIEKGYGVSGVFGFGNQRNKSIYVRFKNEGEEYRGVEPLKKELEKLLCERLSCIVSEDSPADVIFTSAPKYRIDFAKRTVKAEGEEGFCGDTINIFESNRDIFYSFISDGMGSGRDAALTSSICSVFLSKILSATDKCDISLDMLNAFLRNKGGGSMHECSATVDLLQFDLITGKAQFYKGGAAPSYIYRDGSLFKLRSNTVPLGIIKELDTKKIAIDTSEGDIIVMVSDGVTQSKEECPWLFDLLKANVKTESLASIADMIVKRAKYEGSADDISVVVMKVVGV